MLELEDKLLFIAGAKIVVNVALELGVNVVVNVAGIVKRPIASFA